MALVKTKAVVLDRIDYSETSLIVRFYTQDHGKIQAIVKGAKRLKTSFKTSFIPATLNEIVFVKKQHDRLHVVTEAVLLDDFRGITQNLDKIFYAHYFVELIDKMVFSQEKEGALFELFTAALTFLVHHEDHERLARVFEVKALSEVGLFPDFNACTKCKTPIVRGALFFYQWGEVMCQQCSLSFRDAYAVSQGLIHTLHYIRKNPFSRHCSVQMTPLVKNQLSSLLAQFIRYHVHGELKTMRFIRPRAFTQ